MDSEIENKAQGQSTEEKRRRHVGRVDRVLRLLLRHRHPGERGDGVRRPEFVRLGRHVRTIAHCLRPVHRFRGFHLQGGTVSGTK